MKRIVFVHPDGLHQIIGATPDRPPTLLVADGAAIEVRGRIIPFASLVRVTPRAAYYREPIIPGSYSFHEAQR